MATSNTILRREFLRLTGAGSVAISCGLLHAGEKDRWPPDDLPPLPKRATNVNTSSISSAIESGCKTMTGIFNADDNNIPFFGATVWPEVALSFSRYHSESHVPGRHLNALLTAENALRIKVDEAAIKKHADAAYYSYSGPIPLPLNRDTIGGKPVRLIPHNVREGFHALYALIKYRRCAKAKELAERSIAAINHYWNPETGWDRATIEKKLGLDLVEVACPFITGLARAIGPLVKYYNTTGFQPALDLAVLLKDKALTESFTADGAYDERRLGTHSHSITSVMSSLAQLAEATSDNRLMKRVQSFVENGLKAIADDLGWGIERPLPTANPDQGEANVSGDILETYLILGTHGYTEYLHRAERLLRCHLLPSQLRDTSFIREPENPNNEDGKRNVSERILGAFGFPAPYGHKPIGTNNLRFNLDIVGGVVGSLCEAYRILSCRGYSGLRVNLLFDQETDDLSIESPYARGALGIVVKRPNPLFIRIPPWLDESKLVVTNWNKPLRFVNGFLALADPPVERRLSIPMPMPVEDLALRHRTRDIRVRIKGDTVMAMENFGAELAFFESLG